MYRQAVAALRGTNGLAGRVASPGRKGPNAGFTYLGTRGSRTGGLSNIMEHLSCFAPGMLALGAASDQSMAGHLPLATEARPPPPTTKPPPAPAPPGA